MFFDFHTQKMCKGVGSEFDADKFAVIQGGINAEIADFDIEVCGMFCIFTVVQHADFREIQRWIFGITGPAGIGRVQRTCVAGKQVAIGYCHHIVRTDFSIFFELSTVADFEASDLVIAANRRNAGFGDVDLTLICTGINGVVQFDHIAWANIYSIGKCFTITNFVTAQFTVAAFDQFIGGASIRNIQLTFIGTCKDRIIYLCGSGRANLDIIVE